MSLNHYYISSDSNISEAAQRWSQYMMDSSSSSPHRRHQIPSPPHHDTTINLNHRVLAAEEADEEGHAVMEHQQQQTNAAGEIPKEPLFQKPLTPSDVGKLNRLVIPKQHAEKYFPLNGDSGDQKGLLLSFEDEVGKCWKFRYSYWTSSQSYVLTKGWSRFVKEKRLDAGDVVLFLRHRLDGGRMFIGWRRKDNVAQPSVVGGGWRPDAYYPHLQRGSTSYSNNNDYTHAGSVPPNPSTAVINNYNTNNSKRLRLFGVNLECQAADSDQSEPSTPVGSPMSTSHGQAQAQAQAQPYHHQYYSHYSNNTYTNINFSGGDFYR